MMMNLQSLVKRCITFTFAAVSQLTKTYNELARLVVNADGIKRLEVLQSLDLLTTDEDIEISPQ